MNLQSATAVANGQRPDVAAYLRLSRENEDSASIETQRAAVARWCEQNGYDPASVIEYIDSGVSGAKALEQRKGMHQLMRDRPAVVIAWKLDRYARSVSEFLRLVAWGEAHNVRIATTDNAINTGTPTGRMVAVVLAALAEWEREMIRSRILDGHATRRAQGRWSSGRAPYGYRIVRRDGAAYLEIEPEQAERIRAAVRKLISDDGTVAGTARMVDLSEPQWRRLIKSVTLRGQRESKGKLVCGPDGVTPVQFAEPIISAAERKAIQARLKALATGEDRAARSETPLCAGMGQCYKCDGPLNGGTSGAGVKLYKCKLGHVTIYAETLDKRVETEFLHRFGRVAEYTVRLEGGNDLSDAMTEAQEQAARIAASIATAGPLMLATLEEKAAELEAAYAALRAAHDPDVREVLEPTGRTLGEAWETDTGARAGMLADVGLSVVLHPKSRADRLEIRWASGGEDYALTEYVDYLDA
ncbi:recombinase family protein [Streptomyces sp. NPDC006655]|uniref:recombinase family protein n=1 Tax=Streptomyces sp. NPDC006655 TaxID=3156898 RepID=UPI0034513DDD